MEIHSDELVGSPVIQWPVLEAEQLQAALLEVQDDMLDDLDHTIEHAQEAAEHIDWFESAIMDPAPAD